MLRARRGRGRDKRDILHGLGKLPKKRGERTKNSRERERPFVVRTIHILGLRLISSNAVSPFFFLSMPKKLLGRGKIW